MSLKNCCKRPEWTAALAALLSGLLTHAFALIHLLHNYDNILQQPKGYGAGITSGRWLLEILGDFNDAFVELNFNLSTMNGLGFLLFVALSTALIVDFLKIRNPVSAALTGVLMATFPTVCATLVFRYTAPYYGLSLLLSVLAAWVIGRWKYGFVLSGICLACSMGIYQAYPPFTISLLVLALLRDSLDEDAQLYPLIRRGVLYCIALALGVVLYFVFLKVSLALYSIGGEVVLDTYQGINNMGRISLADLPGLLKEAWLSAALFPIIDYCGLTIIKPMKLLWLLLVLTILAEVIYIVIRHKTKPLLIAFCALMGLLFPLAINFIVVMVPDGNIYTIMIYSFALVGCAPLMLLEYIPQEGEGRQRWFGRTTGLLLAGIILYNGYYANVNYTSLYYANRQVENFVNGLMVQARMTKGYTPEKKWVYVGKADKFMLYDMWYEAPVYGGFAGSTAQGLFNTAYSRNFWFAMYLGLTPQDASQEEQLVLLEDARVQQMPCWPSEGSMQVVDDYLVVKFEEPAS